MTCVLLAKSAAWVIQRFGIIFNKVNRSVIFMFIIFVPLYWFFEAFIILFTAVLCVVPVVAVLELQNDCVLLVMEK
jgi:hypothetical protein